MAQDGTLGPLIADDADALAALVTAATALWWPVPPRINVPHESSHLATLLELGFEARRQLRHMHRGIDGLPGRRECVAGMVSLGEG